MPEAGRACAALALLVILVSGCSWSQYRGDAAHTGYQPFEAAISVTNVSTLTTAWTGPSGAFAVSGGVLYGNGGAGLVALDAAGETNCSGVPKTCAPLWNGLIPESGNFFAPAVANGSVYVSGANSGSVWAFDAAGNAGCGGVPRKCTPLWTGASAVIAVSSPTVSDGKVYVGASTGPRFLTNGRTSLIVDPPDGRVPSLTPEAQQRAAARTQARRARGPADGPEDRALNERCLNWTIAGPPMLPGVYNNNVQIILTRGYTALVSEMIHDARIVPMDGRAHGAVPQWMGDSRGRWDGNTLVVDTIGFTDKTAFRGSSEHLHLVERFTRVDEGTIEYRFTAEDPATWTRPFTVMAPMKKSAGPIYEYACHEGNERSMIGMLRGARVTEKF